MWLVVKQDQCMQTLCCEFMLAQSSMASKQFHLPNSTKLALPRVWFSSSSQQCCIMGSSPQAVTSLTNQLERDSNSGLMFKPFSHVPIISRIGTFNNSNNVTHETLQSNIVYESIKNTGCTIRKICKTFCRPELNTWLIKHFIYFWTKLISSFLIININFRVIDLVSGS